MGLNLLKLPSHLDTDTPVHCRATVSYIPHHHFHTQLLTNIDLEKMTNGGYEIIPNLNLRLFTPPLSLSSIVTSSLCISDSLRRV